LTLLHLVARIQGYASRVDHAGESTTRHGATGQSKARLCYAASAIHVTTQKAGALPRAELGAALIALAMGAMALLWAPAARADGSALDGAWNMGPLTETFTVQQWSAPCGPAPVSRTVQNATPATVHTDQGELSIDAGARTYRTDQCVDPMSTLARDTHSSDGHTWRTRCSTPRNDARHASVNAAYFLTGDSTITIAETGRYEFTIEGARCVADVSRQAALHRGADIAAQNAAAAASDTAPQASAAPALAGPTAPSAETASERTRPAPKPDCSDPGEATRLEVRPSRKLLRVGDSFVFRARVLDSAGCPTPTAIRWSVGPLRTDGPAPTVAPSIDGAGKLTVAAQELTEASFDVIATANGRSARASVEVTSATNYEALLTKSGLDPNGERAEPAVAVLATTSLGASDAAAEDNAHRRRFLFVAVIAGLTLILGVVAVFGAVRGRRARALEAVARERHAEKMREYEATKKAREDEHAAQMRAHLESVARSEQQTAETMAIAQEQTADAMARGAKRGLMFCPSCRREFTEGGGYCPFDANRLITVAGHEGLTTGPAGGVCPTCHRGFNPGVRVCPHDGDELSPAALAAPRPVATRGKICPTCGGRFDGAAAFCGKDGTHLVLLN
jgi:hypothetical protein